MKKLKNRIRIFENHNNIPLQDFAKEVEEFCNSINPASVHPVFCFPMGSDKILVQWHEAELGKKAPITVEKRKEELKSLLTLFYKDKTPKESEMRFAASGVTMQDITQIPHDWPIDFRKLLVNLDENDMSLTSSAFIQLAHEYHIGIFKQDSLEEKYEAPPPPTSALALALMLGNMKNESCGIKNSDDELLEMDTLKGYDLCVKDVLTLLPQIKDGAKEIAKFMEKSKEDFIDYHIKQKQSSLDADNVLKLTESTILYRRQLKEGYNIAISVLKCTIEKQMQCKWGEIMNS